MSTGKSPPRSRQHAEISVRLPHPDDYFTDADLSWSFEIVDATPAVERTAVGLEVWALAIKRNVTIPTVMICCEHGVLGFAPDAETTEIRQALEVVGRAFVSLGSGFRATGVARLRGRVKEIAGAAVTVEIAVHLRQRRGEPEAAITPEIRRDIFIRKV